MAIDMSTEKEGGDITFEHMVDETEQLGESEIQKFFAGATALVTGGTGFLGKLLIEKLLRSCPDIKKIYILARPKKNKDAMKRLQEQFDDVLYDKLRRIHSNFIQKVGIIEGDIGQVGLGLSDEDRRKISDEVDVIFHGAATVRFDEALKLAVHINVRGTKEILLLAKSCTKLRAFVHISTAYSNCVRKQIREEFYDSPIPADKIIDLVDTLDDKVLEDIKNGLLSDFPNTYAYTKAVAEDVVRQYSKGLPVAMIRPAIVIGTMAEPIAGWIDNVYGPTGVVVGAAVGLLHSLQCDPEKVADLVPGDYVVNATIAAAWRTAKDYTGNHEAPPSDLDPPVYNFVSSVDKPLTWKKFMHLTEFYGLNCPTMHAVWYYILYLNPQKWLHTLVCLLLHWIPAYLVDSVLVLMGKKPMLVQAYRKIHKFSEVITYFSTQEWKFENANTKQLYETMRPADRDAFNFDLTRLTWSEYFSTYVKGVRTYLMKDPVETIPGATRKYYMFKCLHYVASCVFFYLLYKLLSFLLLSIF